jgi:DNA polymerase III sliding clamp (beta) subunit (PCNA family)
MKAETVNYQVQAKALRLANVFTSTDDCRPGLMGVSVKGDRLMASDGFVGVKIAAVVEAPEAAPEIIVPRETLKSVKVKAPETRISVNGDTRLLVGDAEFKFQPVDSQFPNMEQVIPTTEPTVKVGVDATLAARVFAALAAYLNDEDSIHHAVTMEIRDPLGPIVIRAGFGDNVTALIMPVRR